MKKGFTLVELAIVLVIIGLLVAGVMAGQELIYQAKLRKAISQDDGYKLAIATFRTKYNQLPGDLKKAKSYFPECIEQPPNYHCNGNGDGYIGFQQSEYPDYYNALEGYNIWRHMTLAGMLPGNYNVNIAPFSPGQDLPSFSLPNSDAYDLAIFSQSNRSSFFGYQDVRTHGAYAMTYSANYITSVSSCASIADFDTKIDDGKYNKGIFRVMGSECSDLTANNGSYTRSGREHAQLMWDLQL